MFGDRSPQSFGLGKCVVQAVAGVSEWKNIQSEGWVARRVLGGAL